MHLTNTTVMMDKSLVRKKGWMNFNKFWWMNKNKIIKVKKIIIVHLKISNYSQKLNQNILAIKKILIVTIEKE